MEMENCHCMIRKESLKHREGNRQFMIPVQICQGCGKSHDPSEAFKKAMTAKYLSERIYEAIYESHLNAPPLSKTKEVEKRITQAISSDMLNIYMNGFNRREIEILAEGIGKNIISSLPKNHS